MISLTGDIATGPEVLAAATSSIKRTHLELGGKAPVIVFDDADHRGRRRRHQALRLLQCRAGLHRGVPHLRQQEDLRQPRRRSLLRRFEPQIRRAQRRRERTSARSSRAASALALRRSSSAPWRTATSRSPPAASSLAGKGFYLRADGRRRRTAVRRNRSARSVRPRRLGHAVLGRGRGCGLGQRFCSTASPRPCGRRTSPEPWPRPPSFNTAAPGSIATSCWSTRCRTAASKQSGYGKDLSSYRSRTTRSCAM